MTDRPPLEKISIVIPVYNEDATVVALVTQVALAPLPAALPREIICVNDGSTDTTAALLDTLPALLTRDGVTLRILHRPRRAGKGAALRAGFSEASGDAIIIQDADLEYDPADYLRLLEPIYRGRADVVYGSRFAGGEPHRVFYFTHRVANALLTTFSNLCSQLNLTDMEVGSKVFRREVLTRLVLRSDGFSIEAELTQKIARLRPRLRIYEVGIAYHGRTFAEGKKITWRDGFLALVAIVRFRFLD